jgi:hypothetical protein
VANFIFAIMATGIFTRFFDRIRPKSVSDNCGTSGNRRIFSVAGCYQPEATAEVIWPSGITHVMATVAADSTLTVTERNLSTRWLKAVPNKQHLNLVSSDVLFDQASKPLRCSEPALS